jgi:predicted RNA binding protein YcfA (HicA-like mRNA interferase family)
MAAFPSLKAKQIMAVLEREPLGYSVTRQSGSHRQLKSRNGYPPIRFWAHDGATLARGVIREILCKKVGLSEDDALALLKGSS